MPIVTRTTSRGFFHLSTASQLGELEEDGLEGFYNWIEEEVEKTKRSRPAKVIHFMPHYMRRLQQNKRDK